MKTILILTFLVLALLGNVHTENESALRIAIHESEFESTIRHFSPQIIEQINHIVIPDQSFKTSGISITLSRIVFSITQFIKEYVKIDFQAPDIINISIQDIKAAGSFNGKFKWNFISNSEDVTLSVDDVDVSLVAQLNSREVDGKILPHAKYISMNLNIDFDFSFHGSILSKILDLVKKPIKNLIKSKLQEWVKAQCDQLLEKAFNWMPIYIEVAPYSIDYTLISTPLIQDDYIVFNSYGALVNKNIPETMEKRFELPTTLPVVDAEGKHVQVYVGDYVFNTALYTIYKSNKIEVNITPEMIPESVPIQLTTSWLTTIFWGIDTVYGKNVPCEIKFALYQNPTVEFNDQKIVATLPTEVTVNVRANTTELNDVDISNELTTALTMTTNFRLDMDFHLLEKNNMTLVIHDMGLSGSNITMSNVPQASADVIEAEFNLVSSVVIPSLNKYVQQLVNITFPSVKGVLFDDLNVAHHDKYIAVNYHFTFENETIEETPRVQPEEWDTLKIECKDNKIVKKMKMIIEDGLIYYRMKCVNREFYQRKKNNFVCSNDRASKGVDMKGIIS